MGSCAQTNAGLFLTRTDRSARAEGSTRTTPAVVLGAVAWLLGSAAYADDAPPAAPDGAESTEEPAHAEEGSTAPPAVLDGVSAAPDHQGADPAEEPTAPPGEAPTMGGPERVTVDAPPDPFARSKHPHFTTEVAGVPMGFEARAQARVRVEGAGPRTLNGGIPESFVTHRVRLGTTFASGDLLQVTAEIQDVRTWGEELPLAGKPADVTLFGYAAPSLDLHQGFAQVAVEGFTVRVGRQEISLDGQRLVGAVDWTMQGRSFDGVRAQLALGGHTLDAFGVVLREADASTDTLAVPDAALLGAHYEWGWQKYVRVAPLVLADATTDTGRVRWTTGGRADGNVFGITYDVEAYYQGALIDAQLSTAFLGAVSGGYAWDGPLKPAGRIFLDVVSGNSTTVGTAAFDTLFATNHKFYGFQDLFLNLPLHTGGRGLVDVGATGGFVEGPLYGKAFVHVFGAADADPSRAWLYGVEPDVVAGYTHPRGLKLEVGASLFIPIGPGLGRGSVPTPWLYMALGAEI